MTRPRTALALAVLAVLAVVATVMVALATRDGSADPGRRSPSTEPVQVVTDPVTGARFAVPTDDWSVRGPRARIYYADEQGRPAAVVRGPAVFRSGYCEEQPRGSSQAFAGFTRQPFDAWLEGLTGDGAWTTGQGRDPVTLADGTRSEVRWIGVLGPNGACAAGGIELAMVSSGSVRVVLVADTGEPGTLSHDEIVSVLETLATP